MTRIRRRNYAQWRNQWNSPIEYVVHPGSILAKHMQWVKPQDGYANIHGPEPDTINVGVLAPYMVELGLEHEYYARLEDKPLWVSFGWSPDPLATLKAIRKPYVAVWHVDKVREPREVKYPPMPDNIMAKDIPKTENWRHRDIGNY